VADPIGATPTRGLLPKLNSLGINEDDDDIRVATMGDYMYMHKNAPIHLSIEAFPAHNHFVIMSWPANWSDLNHIEVDTTSK
jgi:hypothetical protein